MCLIQKFDRTFTIAYARTPAFLWNAARVRRPYTGNYAEQFEQDAHQSIAESAKTRDENEIRIELEKLQVATIYSLVEQVTIKVDGGRTATKQVL